MFLFELSDLIFDRLGLRAISPAKPLSQEKFQTFSKFPV